MSGTWGAGWITGDVVTAAEFAKGMGSIGDTTLSEDTASITFPPIPGTYAALLLIFTGRGDTSATNRVRFNSDSGNNYEQEQLLGSGAAASAVAPSAVSGISLPDAPTSGSTPMGCAVWIPNYAGTTFNKSVLVIGGKTPTTGLVMLQAASWLSTAAITSLAIVPGSGNLVAGSRATLYALGGS